jgi:sugar O-acyltransferase (sialic acid O-acetyltransferase NeuD family)
MRTEASESGDRLLIVGGGGHCKVVIDALLSRGVAADALHLADDDARLHGRSVLGVVVRGALAVALPAGGEFHVSIGHNTARERVARCCGEAGLRPRTVRHPGAVIAPSSTLGAGSFVAAGAIVGPSARIGEHCIVNHGAVVDHDCVIGACSHVAPRATLGGAVRVGARTLIGAGATVLPGVEIGDDCVVGAGAVVLGDVPAGATMVGVPAQRIGGSPR